MKISFLVIATEILEGKVQDINTLALSKFLKSCSLTLDKTITVSDKQDQILESLKLLSSSDLVVISGGLGPTPDDLTKDCLAKFLQVPLVRTKNSEEIARKNYEDKGQPFSPDHPYQQIPQNSQALYNPEGYAPGLLFNSGNTRYISLPGVPREFRAMMELHLPNILHGGENYLDDFIIRTKGIAEEKIFTELDSSLWERLSEFGPVASLPYLYGVDITLRLNGKTPAELETKKEAINSFLATHPLKKYIWHIGDDTLEERIIHLARTLKLQFGFAESCTGGLCSDKITNINGSSAVFYGSVVCYNTQIKTDLLKVSPKTLKDHDVVSEAVAIEMAQGLRSLYPIDVAVAITGYAGPHDKEEQIPIGTVCIGISSSLGVFSQRLHFVGDRQRLKEYFQQAALFQLLETLEKLALVDMSSSPL